MKLTRGMLYARIYILHDFIVHHIIQFKKKIASNKKNKCFKKNSIHQLTHKKGLPIYCRDKIS